MLILFQQSDVIGSCMFMYEVSLMGNVHAPGVLMRKVILFTKQPLMVTGFVSLRAILIHALNNETSTSFHFIFIYNLNQQSEFTFYKLMLWLSQCLDGESSSGESPVPQIRLIGQFLLSRLFSLNSSVLRSGFSWVSSLVWCLLHFWWMTSCTYDMPRSACSLA
jgi:hypothetical protein